MYASHVMQVKKLQTWQHLVLGAISGGLAATATMPLDVTKTVSALPSCQMQFTLSEDIW